MAVQVKKRRAKNSTPLEARYSELLAKEENLRKQKERAQRALEQAPLRKAQQEKRRREELLMRSARERRTDFPESLHGRMNAVLTSAPRARRALRSEQRHARLKFFGLAFGLVLLLVWLFSVWR